MPAARAVASTGLGFAMATWADPTARSASRFSHARHQGRAAPDVEAPDAPYFRHRLEDPECLLAIVPGPGQLGAGQLQPPAERPRPADGSARGGLLELACRRLACPAAEREIPAGERRERPRIRGLKDRLGRRPVARLDQQEGRTPAQVGSVRTGQPDTLARSDTRPGKGERPIRVAAQADEVDQELIGMADR